MVAPTLPANYHHSMKLHWSDWNRACISAAVLLALAGLAVFKIPHGFEEGVGWYVCLLPGAIFAAAIVVAERERCALRLFRQPHLEGIHGG